MFCPTVFLPAECFRLIDDILKILTFEMSRWVLEYVCMHIGHRPDICGTVSLFVGKYKFDTPPSLHLVGIRLFLLFIQYMLHNIFNKRKCESANKISICSVENYIYGDFEKILVLLYPAHASNKKNMHTADAVCRRTPSLNVHAGTFAHTCQTIILDRFGYLGRSHDGSATRCPLRTWPRTCCHPGTTFCPLEILI